MTPNKLHILAGLLTALAVGWPCLSGGLFAGLWGCLAGIIAGSTKEWCDKVYSGKFDLKDLGYTCLGVGLAMVCIVVVHLIF